MSQISLAQPLDVSMIFSCKLEKLMKVIAQAIEKSSLNPLNERGLKDHFIQSKIDRGKSVCLIIFY